jgi:hypothetical protein
MPTPVAEGLHKYFVFVDVTLWLAVPGVLRLLTLHQRSLALTFGQRDSLGSIAKSDTSESSNLQLHYLQPKNCDDAVSTASLLHFSLLSGAREIAFLSTKPMHGPWVYPSCFAVVFNPFHFLSSPITSLQSCSSETQLLWHLLCVLL